MAYKDELGRAGEQLAAQWVRDQGWQVLATNWRGPSGELDLVAREGETIVAIEVKTRSSTRFGTPVEAVTARKVARLRRLFGQWLAEHDLHPEAVRIDVVGVHMSGGRIPTLTHLRGVS